MADPDPPATAATDRFAVLRWPFVALLLFAAVALLVYAPALNGQFLWDDLFLVKGNGLIRSPLFVAEVFRHRLFDGESNFYRPTQLLTYIADYWCWGNNPFGFHLSNILLQSANGCLLYLLLRRILPRLVPAAAPGRAKVEWSALALAMIWAVHPVHSAAVAYIAGRADSLAMLFCVSAWLASERALDAAGKFGRLAWGALAFASFLLGLCAKEIAFVWLILFTLSLLALRMSSAVSLRRKLTTIGFGLGALGIYVWLRHLPPVAGTPPGLPPMPARWLLMFRALGDYGRLLLFPDRLFMERQVFPAPGLANPETNAYYFSLAVSGAMLLAALVMGACLPGRGRLLRRYGAGWFIIAFLPISNLTPLNASVAEHWLYLPSIGFLLFVAGVLMDVPWQRYLPVAHARTAGALAILIVAGLLSVRTWYRAHDWVDGMTFYTQTLRDGGDFPRAREGLAGAYTERHDYATATALLTDIVKRFPHAFSARVNLATSLLRQGRIDEGRSGLEGVAADLLVGSVVHGGPREYVATIRNLDRLEGDSPQWVTRRAELLAAAARQFPDSWDFLQFRLQDLDRAHENAQALTLVRAYSDAHWWDERSLLMVGQLENNLGRSQEALAAWKQAARLDVYDTQAPDAEAALYLTQGKLDEAIAWQREAVAREPGSVRQHLLLGRDLASAGREAEAAQEAKKASQLAATPLE